LNKQNLRMDGGACRATRSSLPVHCSWTPVWAHAVTWMQRLLMESGDWRSVHSNSFSSVYIVWHGHWS